MACLRPLFTWITVLIEPSNGYVLGWVHTIGNWMRVSLHPIRIPGDCDWLSMEPIHTSLDRLWCELRRSPVCLLVCFRYKFSQKFGVKSDLKRWMGAHRTLAVSRSMLWCEPSLRVGCKKECRRSVDKTAASWTFDFFPFFTAKLGFCLVLQDDSCEPNVWLIAVVWSYWLQHVSLTDSRLFCLSNWTCWVKFAVAVKYVYEPLWLPCYVLAGWWGCSKNADQPLTFNTPLLPCERDLKELHFQPFDCNFMPILWYHSRSS